MANPKSKPAVQSSSRVQLIRDGLKNTITIIDEAIETLKDVPKGTKPGVALPDNMTLTDREKGLVARLIRVRRTKKYWLGYFIEHLLHMDAVNPDDLSTKQASEALEVLGNFVKWQRYFEDVTENYAVLKDFPGLEWYPWDEDRYVAPVEAEVTEKSFTQKEQLEAELFELRTLITSPRAASFRPQAAEYAQRLGKALDRMAKENRQIDKDCGGDAE